VIIKYQNKNIFAFSDTHGRHGELEIPPDADMLICAGDVCDWGDGSVPPVVP
jgi:hypothetical protein